MYLSLVAGTHLKLKEISKHQQKEISPFLVMKMSLWDIKSSNAGKGWSMFRILLFLEYQNNFHGFLMRWYSKLPVYCKTFSGKAILGLDPLLAISLHISLGKSYLETSVQYYTRGSRIELSNTVLPNILTPGVFLKIFLTSHILYGLWKPIVGSCPMNL